MIRRPAHLALLATVALTLGTAVPAAAAPETTCAEDSSGDTVNNDTDAATSEPRADITQQCTSWGDTLTVQVEVEQPTNPANDPAWNGGTFVGWFVDTTGDGNGEFFIDYGLDSSRNLVASVIDLRTDPPARRCLGDASYTGQFIVSGMAAACFDSPGSISTIAGVFYDDGSVVHRDTVGAGTFPAAVAQGAAGRGADRLSGGDRFGTSARISQRQFPDGDVEVAYLARGDVFADAVAGGSLTNGPILLVPSCGTIPSSVSTELGRLSPARVVALGGTSAVCDQMLTAAANAAGLTSAQASRLRGTDRYGTAVAISQAAFPSGAESVYLSRADVFVDAVAGGVLVDGPVLLVPSTGSVPASVKAEIARLDPKEVVALGGVGAISSEVLADAGQGRAAGRLRGADRFTTAVRIAERAFPQGAPAVYLARADLVADAIAGGVLTDGPILLVDSCGDLPTAVTDAIRRLDPTRVTALGGTSAICAAVLDAAAAA